MPEINLLSQSTIDKIAAGEVVERPLNVVKELTENAIDAGASAITAEIKDGGISLIRVTDNGCGIEKDQLKKAFLRHATSKITSIEDLNHTESLGFRGEALSSIAAVSQVEVITKTKQELTGIRYAISGGQEEDLEEIGAPSGTTFLVRNLFFNTPVRKKFLKQPQTEGGYVSDMMEHLALSHPDISIKFINNGQVRFHTSGNGDLKEIIYRIYGRETTDTLIPFSFQDKSFQVSGFLGKPQLNRSNRNFETYFVNGRYVKNDIITRAVEEGYRAYLMQHKFPFFVLHFTMSPSSVDVNVHPAKMEIRILQENRFFDILSLAVSKCMKEQELIPSIKLMEESDSRPVIKSTPEPFEVQRTSLLREESEAYAAHGKADNQPVAAADIEFPSEPKVADFLQKMAFNRVIGGSCEDSAGENEGIHANVIKADQHILVEKPTQLNFFEEKFLSANAREEYRILGQLFDTYWLIAFRDKLLIMDQHAAHEKVKYERLLKELREKTISSQMINPPVVVSLTGKEEELLVEFTEYFSALGFEIEEFGGGSYAIRSIPSDLYGCNEKSFFMEILDELSENPIKGNPEVILQKLASMACKAAVKGNQLLSCQEVQALIDELLTLENPYHCPHGRPTIISMSKYEIEKKFKRIV
ncbi:MAG: DNA mismatch repair endonuclease MutL [Lachnospiraceae bacterium]|nr:DNA mismatch repair endonuclease MutL [Lachnospiraceae bacterium]